MYVEVAFHLRTPSCVRVPAAAMIFRTNGPQLAIVDDNDEIHFHNVTIGVDNGNMVDLAEGVKVGERVALNVSSQIVDGERVKPSVADATSSLRVSRSE
jgi:hypothetical protein